MSPSCTMVVANGVVGDGRVIKTAQYLSRETSSFILYGVSSTPNVERLQQFNFPVQLVPNPKATVSKSFPSRSPKLSSVLRLIEGMVNEIVATVHKPQDILHTHDMVGLAIGARLRRECPNFFGSKWIHDCHEFVAGLTDIDGPLREEMHRVELAHIEEVDFLTTVSPSISDILDREFSLSRKPPVVLNAPVLQSETPGSVAFKKSLRQDLALSRDTPLIVYSGNAKPIRALDVPIRAISSLSSVHLVFITNNNPGYLSDLLELARSIGCESRVHFLPYVPSDQLVDYLRDADVGVHPIKKYPNAEVALPNKLFEYLHAELPIVTSDNALMMEFLEDHQCGFTFREGDVGDCSQKLSLALEHADQIRNGIRKQRLAEKFCWEKEIAKVAPEYQTSPVTLASLKTPFSDRVMLGPTFAAGQPKILSDALKNMGARSQSLAIGASKVFKFQADKTVPALKSFQEFARFYEAELSDYDVFIFFSRSFLHQSDYGGPTGLDLLYLRLMGKTVLFSFRGSDGRLASVFKETNRFNYVDEAPRGIFQTSFVESSQSGYLAYVSKVCDGIFVPDGEMQTYLPGADVIPRAIDINEFSYVGIEPSPDRAIRILHAPTDPVIKGTAYVEAAIKYLRSEGIRVDFRCVSGADRNEIISSLKWADVVVDQLRIGWFGVFALEAMALGKVVVTYIRDDLVYQLPSPAPVVNANPDTVADVLKDLVLRPESLAAMGRVAREHVEAEHDAEKVVARLRAILARPKRSVPPDLVHTLFAQFSGMTFYNATPPSCDQASIPSGFKERNYHQKDRLALKWQTSKRLILAFRNSYRSGGLIYATKLALDWLNRRR